MAKVLFVGEADNKEETLSVLLDLAFRPVKGDIITIDSMYRIVFFEVSSTVFEPNGNLMVFGRFNYKKHKED